MVSQNLNLCEISKKKYKTIGILKIHIQLVHKIQPELEWTCGILSKSYKTLYYIQKHIKEAHIAALICEICGEVFIEPYYLKKHIYFHKNEHRCEFSRKVYTSRSSYRSHRNKRHINPKEPGVHYC